MNDAEAANAIRRAVEEGRVDGRFRCPRCGMRSRSETEARECCRGLGPDLLDRVSHSRFERLE